MIKTYKIINGNSNVNPDIIFQFAQGGREAIPRSCLKEVDLIL